MDFTTWINLGTVAGATAFVVLVVQFLKAPLDKMWKIPTRAFVYVLSLVVLIAADAVSGGLAWESAGLDVINAIIVSVAAMGTYEATFNKKVKAVEEYGSEEG